MDCPDCASHGRKSRLTVRDTRQDPHRLRITRRRVCDHNGDHIYETVEQPGDARIDQLGVRRASDGRVTGRFSRQVLARGVADGVLKRLPDSRVQAVVDDVYATLQERVHVLYRDVSDDDSQFNGAIDEDDIIDTVEARLRHESHETVYALYVLSTRRGRPTRNAFGFLNWLAENAGRPDVAQGLPAAAHRPSDRWYPSGPPPTVPVTVIKRRDGDHQPFNEARFAESVRQVFQGRNDPDVRSSLVAQWVLWGLAGQETVLSAQLAIGVMHCLRRVDDIAYLRWASVAKNIDLMGDLVSEAEALLRYPSPRLIFDPACVPYLRPRDAQHIQAHLSEVPGDAAEGS